MSEQDQVVLSIFLLFAIVGGVYWYVSKRKSRKSGSGGVVTPGDNKRDKYKDQVSE